MWYTGSTMKTTLFNYRASAVKFRQQGLSYNEIRKHVPVSKSTLSLWLKRVPLTPKQRARLYTKQIHVLSLGSQSQRERRLREVEEIIDKAVAEIRHPLSRDTYLLMGAALYWAEGSKGRMFELTNSDPHLILFMVRWIEKIFDMRRKNLKARLNIYPQQNEKKVKKFWSDLTGIPLTRFGKSFVKPKNKGYKKNNLYFGTMRIEVPKSSNIRHQVFGWIKGALLPISKEVAFVHRKWQHLTKVERPVNLKSERPHNSIGRVPAS